MVQRTIVKLEDDIDGGPAEETVAFGIDGTSYEIDLSAKNAAALRDAVALYVGAARKAGRPGRAVPAARGRSREVDLAAVRAWARAQGHQVSDRGRVSATIQEAYDAAH